MTEKKFQERTKGKLEVNDKLKSPSQKDHGKTNDLLN